ncbi:nickel pincer cofactor biosynthesis protein LarC [Phytohabitans suffuscus]|uniref:LarC family nickel insertion protein n=1 Tax=Phytohabitans suffuscus TaxID=624315 RepID=A0A6F8YRQ1_9ACTN|nr:LarC family nickel insertion protein [Phytohabitans suffuscus]BCB88827.1 hypothetical protein Psuf_061400 [Phytohabitans suffuscus]
MSTPEGPQQTLVGWFDASAGASGDMLLGSLVGVGVPLDVLAQAVDAVDAGPVKLTEQRVHRHGLAATQVRVHQAVQDQPHRHLRDIHRLLDSSTLTPPVRDLARAAFDLLGAAEAWVHDSDPDHVHFHEVGALDAIADIVGVSAGVDWLRRTQGLGQLAVGPIEAGSATGQIRAAHGRIPVPAPAVVDIARRRGLVLTGDLPYEACTPTGIALLAVIADRQAAMPPLRPHRVGLGAGTSDPGQAANVLRLIIGAVDPACERPAALPSVS